MSDTDKMLERYGEIKLQIFDLQTEMSEIEQALERHVTQNGPVAAAGFVAEYNLAGARWTTKRPPKSAPYRKRSSSAIPRPVKRWPGRR